MNNVNFELEHFALFHELYHDYPRSMGSFALARGLERHEISSTVHCVAKQLDASLDEVLFFFTFILSIFYNFYLFIYYYITCSR